MPGVLHIIDPQTSRQMLDQLQRVLSPLDRIVSIGPVPAWALRDCVLELHRPMGSARLCGWRHSDLPGGVKVHAWSLAAAGAGASIARERSCGLVVSLPHGPAAAELSELRTLAARYPIVVTVPTHSSQARLAALLGDAAPVAILPPCVPKSGDLAQRRQQAREALALAEDQPLVVAPAEMTPCAGHRYACWIHAILREIKDLRLLLPSEGPYWPTVRRFADSTGYGDEIFMPRGRIELNDVLAAADLAVFFFGDDNGLSNLPETMAAGLPIVAWDNADVREVLGDAGKLTPAGDVRTASAAELQLLDDPALRRQLGNAVADRAAADFTVDACRSRLVGIYESASHRQ